MQQYKEIQKTTLSRHINSVTTHKILDIIENDLIVQLWPNSDKTDKIKVSAPLEYKKGEFIDLQVIRTNKNSYSVMLIGHTPPQFCPVTETGGNVCIS